MNNSKLILVGIVALIIGAAGGFFGGMKYQQSKTPTRAQFAAGGFGGGATGTGGRTRGAGAGANGMAVRGTIIKADSSSITVKIPDGGTKIVILSSTTMIGKSTTGAISDLTNGATVTAFGTTNSDGSVTAQNVQVGSAMMFGGRPGGSPAASPVGQ